MLPRGSAQEQAAGDGGRNYQAGGDIIVHADVDEMRTVALAVYRENALELRGIAEDVAYARADRLTNEFLTKLKTEHPRPAASLADPDMQSVLFDAQSQYARSGEEDLGQVLVDLLADRASEEARTLRTLALNEAIHSAPKLTEKQRRVIALVFILRYARYMANDARALCEEYIKPCVAALAEDLPEKSIEYQHIEYVGAGSVSVGSAEFISLIRAAYSGLFTRGFDGAEIPLEWDRGSLSQFGIRPALRDSEKFQVQATGKDDLPDLVDKLGKPEILETLKRLNSLGVMDEAEIMEELCLHEPTVEAVAKKWNESDAKNLTLTSVGIAIGHAYWRRFTGEDAPLGMWL